MKNKKCRYFVIYDDFLLVTNLIFAIFEYALMSLVFKGVVRGRLT